MGTPCGRTAHKDACGLPRCGENETKMSRIRKLPKWHLRRQQNQHSAYFVAKLLRGVGAPDPDLGTKDLPWRESRSKNNLSSCWTNSHSSTSGSLDAYLKDSQLADRLASSQATQSPSDLSPWQLKARLTCGPATRPMKYQSPVIMDWGDHLHTSAIPLCNIRLLFCLCLV